MNELYDVIAVDLKTYKVRIMATGKSEGNAWAIVDMAVMRRGVDREFFKEVLAGTFADGDSYTREAPE